MKALVTGGTGFAGKHLIRELLQSGYSVVATSNTADVADNVETINVDLTDSSAVNKIDFTQIDAIYNLAGLAAVGPSFANPKKYLEVNSEIQINLFEACLKQNVKPRSLVVSSGNVYCTDQLPITEDSEVEPVSPYAVSKIAQEVIGQYYSSRGFEVVTSRSFNHIGPGQLEGFIAADLAKQIAEAEKSGKDTLLVGNLDAKRDYTDVRDIAKAYRLLVEKGRPGEIYNVCSGKSVSGHKILQGLLGHTQKEFNVEQNPELMRPSDKPDIYGSNAKIKNDTGWQPRIPLAQTLGETLEYWRSEVSKSS
jgi:GDP-4-dehydro-6-deoxy-D-mannose reductase